MALFDRSLVTVLVLIGAIGPWTRPIAIVFGLSEFERYSVVDMTTRMALKIPESYLLGAPYFIGVPLVLILLRYFLPRVANLVQYIVVISGMAASIATLPLLWIPVASQRTDPNVMGDIFVSDFVVMAVWHSILCLYDEYLPPWSFAFGPLFGLGLYIFKDDERPASVIGGVVALYSCIGSLHRGYAIAESLGDSVLTQTVGIGEWYGYEIYAAVNIIGGFVLICASTPVPKRLVESVEVILYTILTNGNVGAGWIASMGFVRGRLRTPKPPFRWKPVVPRVIF